MSGVSVRGPRVRDGRSGGDRGIVDAFDLDLPAGSRVGVVGPSSAEVTAILSAVALLRPAADGSVEIDGVRIGPDAPTPKQLGYLPESGPWAGGHP